MKIIRLFLYCFIKPKLISWYDPHLKIQLILVLNLHVVARCYCGWILLLMSKWDTRASAYLLFFI